MACIQWAQPEQDSQSHRTWSNVVENPTKQHCSDNKVVFNNFNSRAAEEFIPLETGGNAADVLNQSTGKDNKLLKRKLSNSQQNNNSHVSSTESAYCTPWKSKNYVQDPTGLNEEIHDFLNYIKPRPEEDAIRRDVVERVKAVIKQLWSQAKVELFGSCQTGLYLPTSDIDLVVHGKWESLPLRTLENELIAEEIADPNSIRVLDKAAVPIIKVTDKKTQVKIDISFNMDTGVQSAEMIKSYMDKYPALPYLTFVLKQFLVNRDLNEVFSGGISSYTVVLMIVSFFQHSGHFRSTNKDVNLGVLLIEFFELYGKKFNYNNVGIRVVGNGSYFNKELVLGKSLANTTHLCIEDPLTKGNYIGKGSFRINEVMRAFEWASSILTHGVLHSMSGYESCSILGRITRVRREAVEQRERMLHLSPCISPNIPSYASVATRNTTRTTTIRSIQHDAKTTDSPSKSDGACGNSQFLKARQNATRDGDEHRNGATANRRIHRNFRSIVSRVSDSQNGEWRKSRPTRDSENDRGKEQHFSRETPPRNRNMNSSSSIEKGRILQAANSKQSSPKRSASTESCGMRSSKGVKSIKESHPQRERLLC
ncbi:terminal nucleotidyltransferase 4A-like [Dendronephthya gigantea]|uniref:terminal nucleotidyltransferase 4A-like n=1 Tax=Dendronephthya gigantea TaxID=151771 RepID=UPI00106BB832|nr:terminal nucleotidyltransferase 4A-like [Dendronephthya gigantea]